MSAIPGGPTAEQHIDQLRLASGRIIESAARAGLDAPVPTCPDWTLDDVLRHVGGVQRWALDVVAQQRTGRGREMFGLMDQALEATLSVPADELISWFTTGEQELAATLQSAPDDLACWTFLPDGNARDFWTRRQSLEASMHSVDAQLAAGPPESVAPFPPWLAADGLDELLTGFVVRPGAALRLEQEKTLAVVAVDAPSFWLVTIGPEAITTTRAPHSSELEAADATLSGTAHDLYCELWNRPPLGQLIVTGDASLVDAWHGGVKIV